LRRGSAELVIFCKGIGLIARLLNAVTELYFVYVSLMLQLNADFKTVMWDNTTCDATENYYEDGGSVSFTVTSHTLIVSAQLSRYSVKLKV
jgi:hypothetical protein